MDFYNTDTRKFLIEIGYKDIPEEKWWTENYKETLREIMTEYALRLYLKGEQNKSIFVLDLMGVNI